MLESVRVRLTLWYTAVLALVLVALALAGYLVFRRDTVQRTDGDLAELSSAFLTTLDAEMEDQPGPDRLKNAALVAITEHRFRDHVFVILGPEGSAYISSLDVPPPKSAPEVIPEGFLSSASFRKFVEASSGTDRLYQNVKGGKGGYRGYARHFPAKGQIFTLVILRSLHTQQEML